MDFHLARPSSWTASRPFRRAFEGLGVKQGGRVALLSENRPEWSIVDFACQCYGAVLVPIFPTMVPDQAAYLIKDSGATVAFASTPEQAAKILAAREASSEVKQTLKHVVVFDGSPPPGTTAYAERRREGPRRVRRRPAGVREARRRPPALRPRDAHLHVRNDGRAEGRDAHAEQLRLERRLGLLHRALRLFRGRALVPPSLARLRKDASSTPTTTGRARSRTRSRSTSCATTSPR